MDPDQPSERRQIVTADFAHVPQAYYSKEALNYHKRLDVSPTI